MAFDFSAGVAINSGKHELINPLELERNELLHPAVAPSLKLVDTAFNDPKYSIEPIYDVAADRYMYRETRQHHQRGRATPPKGAKTGGNCFETIAQGRQFNGTPPRPVSSSDHRVLFFLVVLRIQAYLVKRALSQVIERFRQHDSLCSQSPKSMDQLGLRPPGFWERAVKPRDYKPYALQILIRSGAVNITDDEKMCLNDIKLQDIRQKMDF